MTTDPQFFIIYFTDGRWKLHRSFVLSEHSEALLEYRSVKTRFPSYDIEMVRGDGRVYIAENARLADDAMELND